MFLITNIKKLKRIKCHFGLCRLWVLIIMQFSIAANNAIAQSTLEGSGVSSTTTPVSSDTTTGDEGNEDNLDDVLSLLALSYETISTAATNGTSIIKITSATTEKITDTTSAVLPVPGGWRVEDFSECNRTCNGGNKTQTKYCDNPLPSNGGDNCPCSSDTKEIHCDGNTATIIETCNEDPCPVDGVWGDDEEFSECSEKCNGGTRTKIRHCNKPAPSNGGKNCTCDLDNTMEIECNGTVAIIQETCNEHECAVNGSWRYGEEFSNCSKTCGGGTRNKTKHCDYPQPSNGGQNCSCGKDENFTEIFCDGITAILQDSCNEDECLDTTTPAIESDNNEALLISVVSLPIILGLVFLIGLGVWYNRRKRANKLKDTWGYGDLRTGRYQEVELTPIATNGQNKPAKRGIVRKDSQNVGPESDFSIQLDLGGDIDMSPAGFYG